MLWFGFEVKIMVGLSGGLGIMNLWRSFKDFYKFILRMGMMDEWIWMEYFDKVIGVFWRVMDFGSSVECEKEEEFVKID